MDMKKEEDGRCQQSLSGVTMKSGEGWWYIHGTREHSRQGAEPKFTPNQKWLPRASLSVGMGVTSSAPGATGGSARSGQTVLPKVMPTSRANQDEPDPQSNSQSCKFQLNPGLEGLRFFSFKERLLGKNPHRHPLPM